MPDRSPAPASIARRYHLHLPGLLYIAVTVVLGIGAMKSQNNLLFIVFGVSMAALLFSGVMSGAMLMGLRVERRTPPVVEAGRTMRLSYTVRNASRFVPIFGLSISEMAPSRRNAGRPWTSLFRPPRLFVAQVDTRSSVRARAEALALRRGVAPLSGVLVTTTFPIGVFRKSVRFAQPDEAIVLPAPRPLSPGIFHAIQARSRFGDVSVGRRGSGDEFYGLRDYVRGDSPRFIAWKASARSGNLVTRMNAAHASSLLRILLLLDPDEPPDPADPARSPNERCITLAASLIDEAIGRSAQVGLSVPQAGLLIPPGLSTRHRQGLLKALALIDLASLAPSDDASGATGLGVAAPNVVIAPDAHRHPLAPSNVPALGPDALARWGLADPPRPHAGPAAPDPPGRTAA